MKTTISILSIALALMFTFNACEKAELNQNQEQANDIALAPPGFENPLEVAGIIQIDVLNQIIALPDFPKVTDQEVYNITVELLKRNFPEKVPPTFEQVQDVLEGQLILGMPDGIDALFERNSISSKVKQQLTVLHTKVHTSKTSDVMNTRLVNFENAVVNRQDLNDDEKDILLYTSVSIRYTFEYMEDVLNNSANKWNMLITDDIVQSGRAIHDVIEVSLATIYIGIIYEPKNISKCETSVGFYCSEEEGHSGPFYWSVFVECDVPGGL